MGVGGLGGIYLEPSRFFTGGQRSRFDGRRHSIGVSRLRRQGQASKQRRRSTGRGEGGTVEGDEKQGINGGLE